MHVLWDHGSIEDIDLNEKAKNITRKILCVHIHCRDYIKSNYCLNEMSRHSMLGRKQLRSCVMVFAEDIAMIIWVILNIRDRVEYSPICHSNAFDLFIVSCDRETALNTSTHKHWHCETVTKQTRLSNGFSTISRGHRWPSRVRSRS